MSNINKILVPFDFSEASIDALEYTINFVGPNRSADILALYVGVLPSTAQEEKELSENFKKVLGSFNMKTKKAPVFASVSGQVIETILTTQVNQKIDLIIMGTMGAHGLSEIFVGTNAADTVTQAPCPVLCTSVGITELHPRKIALATDYKHIDEPSLDIVKQIADLFRSEIEIMHI